MARREQARRVHERVTQSGAQREVDRLHSEPHELHKELRESRRRFERELVKRRTGFVAAVQEELREKLRAERLGLRRLRCQRKRLEAASSSAGVDSRLFTTAA
jgi:hypothetical protein